MTWAFPFVDDATRQRLAPNRTIHWGSRVSPTFKDRVLWIEQDLGIPADSLMDCMAFESGETFSSTVRNGAGSGAIGLIQFMPQTAAALGTSTAALGSMTPEDQLNYVWKYFEPWKGKLHNLGDVYMAILWPAGVGKSDNTVLFSKATRAVVYLQNKGLDVDKDGNITRFEAYSGVRAKAVRGAELAG